ncbi:MAG: glycerol-3-phosphate 1-O-acyltransferase PlsY [Eubacteriales bacterium]|nr:glycerol-3-phosphate 1-O-acyltransferase PlsY [Eubacteriales bacterium]
MDIINLLISAVLGYLLGSLNASLIIGRFYCTDVRKHGSGNAGMTNTLRTLGKKAALLVIVGDVLKGLLACYLGGIIAGYNGTLAGGLFAVIGHNWPLYFRFKGGKGALTSIAVLFYLDWRIALIIVALFVVIVALTRYVSLGSIAGAIALPVLVVAFDKSTETILFSAIVTLLVIFQHRSNIGRLQAGNEKKLGGIKEKGD